MHKITTILTPKNGKHSQNVWLSAYAFVTLLLISRNREKQAFKVAFLHYLTL
ncbi:hypothetical protein D3C73_628990 [compost metagenome]|nr:hypothetical protein [Sphingobacterium sp. BIGb0116]